jgi:hypothetical protein
MCYQAKAPSEQERKTYGNNVFKPCAGRWMCPNIAHFTPFVPLSKACKAGCTVSVGLASTPALDLKPITDSAKKVFLLMPPPIFIDVTAAHSRWVVAACKIEHRANFNAAGGSRDEFTSMARSS